MSASPLVLAIDTSLDACSVALARGDEVLVSLQEIMQRGQAERLAPMVREAAEAAGVAFADIDRVAVTTGPGSFTGVRVGLSFARAMALALERPCIGVNTLEALALAETEDGLCGALIETPSACYAALYEDGLPLLVPQPLERGAYDQVLAAAADGRPYALVGPGALVDAGALALRSGRLDFARYQPDPSYLRAPHVTLPGQVQ